MTTKQELNWSKEIQIHDRSKHIDIRYHFIRDEYKQKRIDIKWIRSTLELADILTKSLPVLIHHNLRYQLMEKQPVIASDTIL